MMVGATNNPGSSPTTTNVHSLTGTLTVATPAAGNVLSILYTSAGLFPSNTISCVVHHADASIETFVFGTPDYMNAAVAPAFLCRGRVDLNSGQINSLNGTANCKLLSQDLALANAASPVTAVDFTWVNNGGKGFSFFFGLSVSADGGTTWSPQSVSSGFNFKPIIYLGVPVTASDSVLGKCNVTIDQGTNNSGNTFYEIGFNKAAPLTGIPIAGSTTNIGTHTYTMPSSYAGNCCLFIANNIGYLSGTLTLSTPTT